MRVHERFCGGCPLSAGAIARVRGHINRARWAGLAERSAGVSPALPRAGSPGAQRFAGRRTGVPQSGATVLQPSRRPPRSFGVALQALRGHVGPAARTDSQAHVRPLGAEEPHPLARKWDAHPTRPGRPNVANQRRGIPRPLHLSCWLFIVPYAAKQRWPITAPDGTF